MPKADLSISQPLAPEHFNWPATSESLPETPEGAALVVMRLIIANDPDLKRRASNQPVAHFMLDMFAACLAAANGRRALPLDREALQ